MLFSCKSSNAAKLKRGFSLLETQITLALFVLVIGGVMVTYLFGLRLFEFIRPKLDASDQARVFMGKLAEEVKTATQIKIGSGDVSSFTEVGVNTSQSGSALQIYPTTDTNFYVRYFRNSSDNTVKRYVNSNGVASTMATCVTNQNLFSAQDYAGNVLTNNQNNRVIAMTLQFFQVEYPGGASRSSNSADFYQLHTRITRRSLL